jgi:erythronate-4-phosphate dehydrogenase
MKIVADENIPFVAECFSSIGAVETVSGRKITTKNIADADVLLVRSITKVNADLLAGSKIRFVGTATIGFEHIDIEYLSQNNIGFASAPGSNANSAAEYIIAGLLNIAKQHSIDLEGKPIGIIGVGNVGSRVDKKCKALGMKTYLNDPPLWRQTGDPKYLPIEELFDCDFITLHTPLTFEGEDKTFHLADKSFFNLLKKGCIFINASRGGVVDSSALKTAIRERKLRATVLDVWENEPNIDVELLEMVDIGTPHIAGYSLDGKIAGMIMIYKAACEYFGLEGKYDISSFLPEPAVPELKIDIKSGSEQDILLSAVRRVYDIKADDINLRRIDKKSKDQQGQYFDHLRKTYPVRREFQNTKIMIATEDTEGTEKVDSCSLLSRRDELSGSDKLKMESILKKLAGIGFKVQYDEKEK